MDEKKLMRKTKKELCELILSQQEQEEIIHCPDCGSDKIVYRSDFMSGSIDVGCADCKSMWFEVWQFKGIEMIMGEDNRVDSNE
jgi:predicted RNA-binding Zn-ribbon protein involved in translation (DUF1610 family)